MVLNLEIRSTYNSKTSELKQSLLNLNGVMTMPIQPTENKKTDNTKQKEYSATGKTQKEAFDALNNRFKENINPSLVEYQCIFRLPEEYLTSTNECRADSLYKSEFEQIYRKAQGTVREKANLKRNEFYKIISEKADSLEVIAKICSNELETKLIKPAGAAPLNITYAEKETDLF